MKENFTVFAPAPSSLQDKGAGGSDSKRRITALDKAPAKPRITAFDKAPADLIVAPPKIESAPGVDLLDHASGLLAELKATTINLKEKKRENAAEKFTRLNALYSDRESIMTAAAKANDFVNEAVALVADTPELLSPATQKKLDQLRAVVIKKWQEYDQATDLISNLETDPDVQVFLQEKAAAQKKAEEESARELTARQEAERKVETAAAEVVLLAKAITQAVRDDNFYFNNYDWDSLESDYLKESNRLIQILNDLKSEKHRIYDLPDGLLGWRKKSKKTQIQDLEDRIAAEEPKLLELHRRYREYQRQLTQAAEDLSLAACRYEKARADHNNVRASMTPPALQVSQRFPYLRKNPSYFKDKDPKTPTEQPENQRYYFIDQDMFLACGYDLEEAKKRKKQQSEKPV